MRRRSRASSKVATARSSKAKILKAARHSSSSASGQETVVARLRRELSEALEQQAAASEVLRVIGGSPGELEPVFNAMLEKAVHVCEAKFGILFRYEGGMVHPTAMLNVPPAYAEFLIQLGAFAPQPGQLFGRICETKRVIHIVDRATERQQHPSVRYGGSRSCIAVPMLKANELIGAFFIYRTEVRPFTDRQIELVKNFAAQAVIAIENTRLLNELRESLDRQTATSEVLSVISSSPGELEPVFQAMLENAVRICEAKFGALYRIDGEKFHFAAEVGTPLEFVERQRRRGPFQPSPGSQLARVLRTKQVSHTDDATVEFASRPLATLAGARSTVAVPMLKDDVLIGAIFIYRTEVRPFTDKQIALVRNFAAQAVIAIENARLLNELRQSLEQQTATADVLRVISSSPGELQPVFEAMLQNAVRICDAQFGNLALFENDGFRFVAQYGAPPKYRNARQREPFIRGKAGGNLDRVIKTKRIDHVADMAAEEPDSGIASLGGARTLVTVPMLKDNELVGMIAIYRQEVRPFSEKQIELLQNFAAQAVIAIENARLLNELRQRTDDLTESLEQQTATSKVLEVISSSPADLKPVFEAILENAVRLCGAKFGNLYLREGDGLRAAAMHNAPRAYAEQRAGIVHPSPNSTSYRAAQTKQPAQIADITKLQAYAEGDPWLISAVSLGGYRGALTVPLLHDDEVIGGITIFRQEAGAFADKQIELLTTLPNKPLSPSRTRGCSTNCASRWSDRPLLQKC